MKRMVCWLIFSSHRSGDTCANVLTASWFPWGFDLKNALGWGNEPFIVTKRKKKVSKMIALFGMEKWYAYRFFLVFCSEDTCTKVLTPPRFLKFRIIDRTKSFYGYIYHFVSHMSTCMSLSISKLLLWWLFLFWSLPNVISITSSGFGWIKDKLFLPIDLAVCFRSSLLSFDSFEIGFLPYCSLFHTSFSDLDFPMKTWILLVCHFDLENQDFSLENSWKKSLVLVFFSNLLMG